MTDILDPPTTLGDALSQRRCIWKEDADGNWEAGCGTECFVLTDGGPFDNSMVYCCYCGGELVEDRYAEPAEGDDDE